MDERLHAFFHHRAGRGDELVVVDLDGAGGHLVEALEDGVQTVSKQVESRI